MNTSSPKILTLMVKRNDQVKEDEMGTACSTNGDIGGKSRQKETTRKTKT
jgi:hypothetical protein